MNANKLSESIAYRLHKIQFNQEKLINENDNTSQLSCVLNKQRYLSEIDEALNNNIIDKLTYNIVNDKLKSQQQQNNFLMSDNIFNKIISNNQNELNNKNNNFDNNNGSSNDVYMNCDVDYDNNDVKYDDFLSFCKQFNCDNQFNHDFDTFACLNDNESIESLFDRKLSGFVETKGSSHFESTTPKRVTNNNFNDFQPTIQQNNASTNVPNNNNNTSNNYFGVYNSNNNEQPSANKQLFTKASSFNNTYNNNSNNNTNNTHNEMNYNCNNNNNTANNSNLLATKFPNSNKMTSTIKYEPRISKCYKRRNEDDNIDESTSCNKQTISNNNNNSNSINNDISQFKSAKEQLVIDNNKPNNSNSNNSNNNNNSASNSYYNNYNNNINNNNNNNGNNYNNYNNGSTGNNFVKKSLGANKRGVHSKFNCPIPKQNDDNRNDMMQQPQQQQQQQQSKIGDVDLSKLKNIDQKLVETIISEIMDHTPPITWQDIAGLKHVKQTIMEIVIWPMLRPDIFTGLRGPPKGLLLFGPPGTGKTLIAKCIANESKSKFFNISSSTLTSKWQGESEKLVRCLFEVARSMQPSVIFIDEVDSLLTQRSDDDREGSRRLKTEFFVQMDGAGTTGDERVLLVGATNRPQELDDAARRRFVKRLYVPLPEKEGRKQIVVNLMKKQACELTDEDIEEISLLTEGYSGADMTNLCREAALGPIRQLEFSSIETIRLDQVRGINLKDFHDAINQVRASVSQSDLEQYFKWNNTFGSMSIKTEN